MNKMYRSVIVGALVLVLLATACSQRQVGLTSAEATALANGATGLPPTVATLVTAIAGTGTALTPAVTPGANQTQAVPVTGGGTPVMLCQFCMDGVAHALVAIPDTATFNVAASAGNAPAAVCNSVETLNGKQVVLCYGSVPASFHLNVCAADGACSDFVVNLQACPNSQAAPNKNKPQATEPPLPTPTLVPTEVPPTPTTQPPAVTETSTP